MNIAGATMLCITVDYASGAMHICLIIMVTRRNSSALDVWTKEEHDSASNDNKELLGVGDEFNALYLCTAVCRAMRRRRRHG